MNLTLLQVPYDSGQFGVRLGRGPLHLVERGLPARLEAAGLGVRLVELRLSDASRTEMGATLELQGQIRRAALEARAAGRLPVSLSGNCATAALGLTTALPPAGRGIVWFDAHADFNTPETSPSGFFDGMALAVVAGDCWQGLAASMEGFAPTPAEQILLVGARDLDAGERQRLARSAIGVLGVEELRSDPQVVEGRLGALARRVERLYLHLDLDVLDPATLRANAYAAEGGLRLGELLEVIERAAATAPIAAASLTAYDPSADPEERGLAVAETLLRRLAELADG
jgi:arginase